MFVGCVMTEFARPVIVTVYFKQASEAPQSDFFEHLTNVARLLAAVIFAGHPNIS